MELMWLGHDSFFLKSEGTIVYIDPWNVAGEKADLIIVTHDHFDHYSKVDIEALKKTGARVFVGSSGGDYEKVSPGAKFESCGISIETVSAYNVNKFRAPGKPFHPKDYCGVGYILEAEGKRIYHAGDTDVIAEMKDIKNIDIALLPVSGTYVMTAEEAFHAAMLIRPKFVAPMHYGSVVGTDGDAKRFLSLCAQNGIDTYAKHR